MKTTKWAIIAAFAYLYLVWGSTFFAIKVAVQDTPPFLVGAIRFLVAGLVLLPVAHRLSRHKLSPRGFRASVLTGVLLAGVGNGSVILAQRTIPSGIAALWVATVPVWILVLNALFFSRRQPPVTALVGTMLGLAGIALLPGATAASGAPSVVPMIILVIGCVGWSFATLWQRHRSEPGTAFHAAAVQATSGGLFLLLCGAVSGQIGALIAHPPSAASWIALAYLAFIGTAVAYSLFAWLLSCVDAQKVSTYALVNPVVAMALGASLAGEALTPESLGAAALVLSAVALILWRPRAAKVIVLQGTEIPHAESIPARASNGSP